MLHTGKAPTPPGAGPPSCHWLRAVHLHHRPRAVPGCDPAPREYLGRLLVLHPLGAAHHHARIRLRDHLNGVLPLPAVLVLSHPRVDDRPRPVRVHPLRQQLGHPPPALDPPESPHPPRPSAPLPTPRLLPPRSGVLHSRRLLPAAAGRSSQRHQHHGQHDTTQHHHSSQLGGSACQHSTTPDHAASPKPMMADPGHPRLPEGPLLPAAPSIPTHRLLGANPTRQTCAGNDERTPTLRPRPLDRPHPPHHRRRHAVRLDLDRT